MAMDVKNAGEKKLIKRQETLKRGDVKRFKM